MSLQRRRKFIHSTTIVLAIGALAACQGNDNPASLPTPTHIVFITQPSSGYPREGFSPAVQVELRDASENRVTSAHDPVTLSIGMNPSAGALSGTNTVNAVAGVATFAGVTIDQTGTGYTLVAISGSLAVTTSSSFNIWLEFATVGAGGEHTCGVTTAGAAYCWGLGLFGQLGEGIPAPDRRTPVAVVNSPTFAAVSGGLYHVRRLDDRGGVLLGLQPSMPGVRVVTGGGPERRQLCCGKRRVDSCVRRDDYGRGLLLVLQRQRPTRRRVHDE